MKIFITGVGGFLGSRMAAALTSRGHSVRGSSHQTMPLGEPFDDSVFANIDVVIHAAHDARRGAGETNIRGTRAWLEAAAARGVERQIFVGSYSSRPHSPSEYGRTKHRLERIFLSAGGTVLRPGLVVGGGGLFARQQAALRRAFVVPVISGGKDPVAVIALHHFLEALEAVLSRGLTGAWNLFYEPQPCSRDFIRAVKSRLGQRARFLSIPPGIAIAAVRLASGLHLPAPATEDQIRSLVSNRSAPWRSDLTELLPDRAGEFTIEYALSLL
jgi:NADH dehydrogenase